MLYAYIDESYLQGKVHLIGALVLTARQVDQVTLALDDVLWKTNRAHPEVSLEAELHGQNLFQRTDDWSCLRQKQAVAFAIYRRALHAVRQTSGVWFIGGVRRIDRLETRYANPWPPHQIALQYALEQVDRHAAEEGDRVTVIADQVPDQAHHEARIRQFQQDGRTPGWKPSSLAALDMPFRWEDSRDHRPLQAADLLTYVYMRKRFASASHVRTKHEIQKLRDTAIPLLRGEHVWTP